jgi:hypothetical protein
MVPTPEIVFTIHFAFCCTVVALFSQILTVTINTAVSPIVIAIHITPVIVVAMLIAVMSRPALFASVVIPFLRRAIIPVSLGCVAPAILAIVIVLTFVNAIVAITSNNLQIFSLSSTVAPVVIGINIAPGVLVSVLAARIIISACSSFRIDVLLSGTVSPSTVRVTPIVAFAVFCAFRDAQTVVRRVKSNGQSYIKAGKKENDGKYLPHCRLN